MAPISTPSLEEEAGSKETFIVEFLRNGARHCGLPSACLPTEPEDVFTGLIGSPVRDLSEQVGAGVRQTLRQLSLTRRIVRCVLGRGRLKLAQVNLFMKLHQIRMDVVDGVQAPQLCVQGVTSITDPRSLASSCTQSIAFLLKSSQIARVPERLSKPGDAPFLLDADGLRKKPKDVGDRFTRSLRNSFDACEGFRRAKPSR